MRFSRPTPDPVDPDPVVHDHTVGLPAGLDAPPACLTGAVIDDLAADADAGAALGHPLPGSPLRPMPVEEKAVKVFDRQQTQINQWQAQADAKLPALRTAAQAVHEDLTAQQFEHAATAVALKDHATELRDQLSEPDRKYSAPPSRKTLQAVVVAVIIAAVIEVMTHVPLVGQTMDMPVEGAVAVAVFIVLVSTMVSFLAGLTVRRWISYEGPPRVRRMIAATAIACSTVAIGFLFGVIGLRLVLDKTDSPWIAGVLFCAIQGGVQLAAAIHGFWHGDPRFREVKQTVKEQESAHDQAVALQDQADVAAIHLEEVTVFDLESWTHNHRSDVADEYTTAVLGSRATRGLRLTELGQDAAADTLQLLPLPAFEPPLNVPDLDDDDDWLTGFTMTL